MTDLKWWGDLPLQTDTAARLQIGPSSLWLRRESSELKVAIQTEPDPIGSTLSRELDLQETQPPAGATLHRFALGESTASLSLMPLLADRPVIARPEQPFSIPIDTEVTVFISTPIWVELLLPGPLVALPLYRPSDTWFGASTIAGELCYSTRTALRMNLEAVPRRPHRAITAVHVRNSGPDSLPLRRIRIPVQHLSLFADATGDLWTQSLKMVRRDAGEASISLSPSPPEVAGRTANIRAPRITAEDNSLLQSITSFLP